MYLSLSIFFLIYFIAVNATEVSNAEKDFSFDKQGLDSQSSTLPTLKGWLKANGIDMNQKIAAYRNGTKSATKSALRSVKAKDGTLLDGSIEIGYYGNEECSGPVLTKLIAPLNTCSADGNEYVMLTLVKDGYAPGVDKIRVAVYFEEECSGEGDYAVETPVRYHKCFNKGTRAVYRPTLPAPAEVDLPVFIASYVNLDSCFRNDGRTGLREVIYLRKNFCVRGTISDRFIAGCDTKGRLAITIYDSTDGSCQNIKSEYSTGVRAGRMTQNFECEDGSFVSTLGLKGSLNFKCLK